MLPRPSRREILHAVGSAAALGILHRPAWAQAKGRVVVVGGGAGGASVAHLLKMGAPGLDVTLVEPKRVYATCFYSNLALGGFRTFGSLEHDYRGLEAAGIKVIHQRANGIDAAAKTVTLADGNVLNFDRLVVSPGIALKFDAIEGYSPETAAIMLHGWLGEGGAQTLKKQIETMDDGGLVVMAAPPNPYRCPPGPYERASMIAHLLKTQKPRSKLLIIDSKDTFSKQPVFEEGWRTHYAGLIEWQPAALTGGGVKRVDPKTMEIETGDGQIVKCAVANIIPAQKAGDIAHAAGLAEGDWCSVHARDFSSARAPDIFVVGDSAIAAEMPKSAYSANSQARVAAEAILADFSGENRPDATLTNICWSMIAPDDSVKIGANYRPDGQKLVPENPFVSQVGEADATRAGTHAESLAWYNDITRAMFAGR